MAKEQKLGRRNGNRRSKQASHCRPFDDRGSPLPSQTASPGRQSQILAPGLRRVLGTSPATMSVHDGRPNGAFWPSHKFNYYDLFFPFFFFEKSITFSLLRLRHFFFFSFFAFPPNSPDTNAHVHCPPLHFSTHHPSTPGNCYSSGGSSSSGTTTTTCILDSLPPSPVHACPSACAAAYHPRTVHTWYIHPYRTCILLPGCRQARAHRRVLTASMRKACDARSAFADDGCGRRPACLLRTPSEKIPCMQRRCRLLACLYCCTFAVCLSWPEPKPSESSVL